MFQFAAYHYTSALPSYSNCYSSLLFGTHIFLSLFFLYWNGYSTCTSFLVTWCRGVSSRGQQWYSLATSPGEYCSLHAMQWCWVHVPWRTNGYSKVQRERRVGGSWSDLLHSGWDHWTFCASMVCSWHWHVHRCYGGNTCTKRKLLIECCTLTGVIAHHTVGIEIVLVSQMEDILEENGMVNYNVSLQSTHVSNASLSVTFRVNLVDEIETEYLIALNSFLSSTEAFVTFSNYTIVENGRGVLYITSAGK